MHGDFSIVFFGLVLLVTVLYVSKVSGFDDSFGRNWDVWHPRKSRNASANNLICEGPAVSDPYECEEVPNSIPAHTRETCNYRNQNFHEQVYKWVAGRGCLLYTPDFLFLGGSNDFDLSAGCIYGDRLAPCLELPKADGSCGCYPFDPALPEVLNVIREAMVPSARGRWENCFQAATDCCDIMRDIVNTEEGHTQCPITFDGWTCWHEAEPGTVAQEICSEFAYSNEGPSCHHFSSKQCTVNATWEIQTDFSSCSIAPRLLRRFRYYIAILSFSVVSCMPAVIVFFMYKRLRITRVALHRNLLIAIIIRNILVIVSRSEIYIDELTNSGDTVMATHSAACRLLAVAERIAANAVFVCMLVEGVYLHRLIVAVFRQKLKVKWLYGIGAVITLLPVVVWAVIMGLYDNHSCWLVYTVGNTQWILDAPRMLILLINTVLFVDVLRVLLTKIRNSENANQLSTAKTTLFLMPIFGTQFLLTALRPSTNDCIGEQIYYYITYTIEGLQGFIVALLYCYINKEVHMLVKATYKKTENAVVSRVRSEANNRVSFGPKSDRRMTYSTDLPEQNNENNVKDPYATVTPKIHVAEIISLQASERLADILDPVYETVENGFANEGYDSLERSDDDVESTSNKNDNDDYYGSKKASNVSIDNEGWISQTPPSNRIYNDMPEYRLSAVNNQHDHSDDHLYNHVIDPSYEMIDLDIGSDIKENKDNDLTEKNMHADHYDHAIQSEDEDIDDMLHEILQYIDENENRSVVLDPNVLSPNRGDSDKIVFIDEE